MGIFWTKRTLKYLMKIVVMYLAMEYIRAYEGKLFTVKEHFERFLRSANEIGLDLGYTVDELIDLVRQLLNENNVKMVGFIFKQQEV